MGLPSSDEAEPAIKAAVLAAMMEELGNKRLETLITDPRPHRGRLGKPVSEKVSPHKKATAQNNEIAQAWANAIQDGQFDDIEAHGVKELDDLGGPRLYAQTTAFLDNTARFNRKPISRPHYNGSRRARNPPAAVQGPVGRLGGLVPDGGRVFRFDKAFNQDPKVSVSNHRQPNGSQNQPLHVPHTAPAGPSELPGAIKAPPHKEPATNGESKTKGKSPDLQSIVTVAALPTQSGTPATPTTTASPGGMALKVGGVIFEQTCIHHLGPSHRIGGGVIMKLATDIGGDPADGTITFERDDQDPCHESIKECRGVNRNGRTVGMIFSHSDRRYIMTFTLEETALQFKIAITAAYRALKAKGLVTQYSPGSQSLTGSIQAGGERARISPALLPPQSADNRQTPGVPLIQDRVLLTELTPAAVIQTIEKYKADETFLDVPIPELSSEEEGIKMAEVLFEGLPVPEEGIHARITNLVATLADEANRAAAVANSALSTGCSLLQCCRLSVSNLFDMTGWESLLVGSREAKQKGIGAFIALIHLRASRGSPGHEEIMPPSPKVASEIVQRPEQDAIGPGGAEAPTVEQCQTAQKPAATSTVAEKDNNKLGRNGHESFAYSSSQLLELRRTANPRPTALAAATFLPQPKLPGLSEPELEGLAWKPIVQSGRVTSFRPVPATSTSKPADPRELIKHVDWLFTDPSTQTIPESNWGKASGTAAAITEPKTGGWGDECESAFDFPPARADADEGPVVTTQPSRSTTPGGEMEFRVRVKVDGCGRIEKVVKVLIGDNEPATPQAIRSLREAFEAVGSDSAQDSQLPQTAAHQSSNAAALAKLKPMTMSKATTTTGINGSKWEI